MQVAQAVSIVYRSNEEESMSPPMPIYPLATPTPPHTYTRTDTQDHSPVAPFILCIFSTDFDKSGWYNVKDTMTATIVMRMKYASTKCAQFCIQTKEW